MTRAKPLHEMAPPGLDLECVGGLLDGIRKETDLTKRIERISAGFLGKPYSDTTLIGGPRSQEILTIRLDAFDCVTYIETVLALSMSESVKEFIDLVTALRYHRGGVEWRRRNHYMIDWTRNNQSLRVVKNITAGRPTIERRRTLAAIPELPRRDVVLRCFPKRRLPSVAPYCETGDIILFVSTRKWLDVFHVGMLVRDGNQITMRHATRTAGSVIEQPLTDFMKQNRMSGFIVLRPIDVQTGRRSNRAIQDKG